MIHAFVPITLVLIVALLLLILKKVNRIMAQDDDLTTAVTNLATAVTDNTQATTDGLAAIQKELAGIPTTDPVVAQAVTNINAAVGTMQQNNQQMEAAAQAILNPPAPAAA